jgi:hypothetical protein
MHFHKWGRWIIKSEENITRNKGEIIGNRILQSRECLVCGMQKYKVTALYIDGEIKW